jgi:hypothetical protein
MRNKGRFDEARVKSGLKGLATIFFLTEPGDGDELD